MGISIQTCRLWAPAFNRSLVSRGSAVSRPSEGTRSVLCPASLRHKSSHADRELAAVMKTMGRRDVKTAMHYQHPELDVVRAALDYGAAGETAEMRA